MKVIMNGQPEPQLLHFSHTHPLILLNIQQLGLQQQLASSCACCKLKVVPAAGANGGDGLMLIYSCIPCNYFLHVSCSRMPQQITHPFDRENHVLILVPTPTYADGVFNCDACMKHGNGFSYHCAACKIDLHAKCASLPMIQPHHSHPHPLTLSFTVPAGPTTSTKSFVCGICHQIGYKEWLYLCTPCSFAAHLGCATAKPRPPPPTHQIQQQAQVAGGAPYSPRHQQPNMNATNYDVVNGTMIQQQSVKKPSINKGQLGKAIVNTALTALIGFPIFSNNPSSSQSQSQSQKQSQSQQHQPQSQQQFVSDGRGGGVYIGSPAGQNMNQRQFVGGGRGAAAPVYAGSTGVNNFNHQQYLGGGHGVYVGSPAGGNSFDQNQFMGGGRGGGRGGVVYQQQFVGGGRGRGCGGAYGGPAGGGSAYGGPVGGRGAYGGPAGGGGAYSGPAGVGPYGGGPYSGPASGDPYGGPAGGNELSYNVNVGVGVDFGSSADCSSTASTTTTDPSYTVEYSTDTTDYYYNCGIGGGDVIVGDAAYPSDPTFTTDFSFGDSSFDCTYLI